MSEVIDAHKLEQRKVFKTTSGPIEVFFREPTIGEMIALEASRNVPGGSFLIIKQIVIEFKGLKDINELQNNAALCDNIISTLYSKAPMLNNEATHELYSTVAGQIKDNPIYRFKSWVSKELNFPDFMYLADGMNSADFLRYIVLAEEITGLSGLFMYAMSGDESHLTDEAKQTMANMDAAKLEAQGPDWQRAGLKAPPRNIIERKQIQEYLRKEAQTNPVQAPGGAIIEEDEIPERWGEKKQRADPEAMRTVAIKRAGQVLAQKIKYEEMLKAQGKPIPRFNFEDDKKLQDYFNEKQ